MRTNKTRKYFKVCPEFIEQFKKDLQDGWSIGYASRTIVNEMHTVKKSFNEFPELEQLYWDYMKNKTHNYFSIKK